MKQRIVLTAAYGAAFLVLAACSQSVQGSAQVGSTTATSTTSSASTTSSSRTSTTSSRTSPSTSTSTSTSDKSTTDTTDSTETETSSSSGLDSDTVYWFTTFCQGISDLTQYASPDTTGQTLAQAQQTVVDAYTNISLSAETTVEVLQQTPPPGIANGGDLAQAAIDRLSSLSDVYGKGAQSIAALTPASEDDLKAAIDAIEKQATDAQPNTIADVDPAVLAAAKQLPDCRKVLN
jgi:hypothetical protein